MLLSLLSYKVKKELQVATFFSEIGHWALGIGHWALVLSVRVASRREVVGAASRREVLGIGHWEEFF